MLIAMMGNTYAHVIEQSEKEWMKQWAKIVITLERAVPQADAHHYLQEYSISLGPSEDPSTEQRGVMVIKSKSKTRAKQRKGAVANWKRVGKVTINALKKRGLTGEEMRCVMWGRESINTPIKKKGPTLDPKDPNLTGAFSGALTAALDVMAFTHDIDLNATSGALKIQNKLQDVGKVALNNQINAALSNTTVKPAGVPSILGTFTQLSDTGNVQGAKPTGLGNFLSKTNQSKSSTSELEDIDPLRELVLCSRSICESEKLETLAAKAANISNADEITLKPNASVKSVAGIFAGTDAFVKKVEQTIKKKYSTLDPSDSDGFGEGPLLGRVSRTRRAKSANSRSTSAKSKFSDKRKLFNESESSSSDTVTNTVQSKEEDKKESLDYVEERIKHIRECMRMTVADDSSQSLRPYNIDVALGNDSLLVALSESTARVEDVAGRGSSRKHKRKKRPKTARANRVTPFVAVMPRGCESANNKVYSEPDSPPDPLEAWSMKGIVTMNKILAWENEQDSM
ncbi:transient receptor potential ion channel protein [Holotrichia oblita]|uniref:Transient receptor potential ion channel protein n=1 Tax=Holotrichia oblita TaxID=644536 RepID=A0ACB9T5I7_HOLOL|nr:transient receptor potential ion channel protein [Holotrichia oblita]